MGERTRERPSVVCASRTRGAVKIHPPRTGQPRTTHSVRGMCPESRGGMRKQSQAEDPGPRALGPAGGGQSGDTGPRAFQETLVHSRRSSLWALRA